MAEWRKVNARPNYSVSGVGQVRNDRTGRILKPWPDRHGYMQVSFYDQGRKHVPAAVHRLVCEAFHGDPPPGKNHAAHKNGDKLCNHAANLYWASRSENELDKVAHGRNANAAKTHCDYGHELTLENVYARHLPRRVCRLCSNRRAHEQRISKSKEKVVSL